MNQLFVPDVATRKPRPRTLASNMSYHLSAGFAFLIARSVSDCSEDRLVAAMIELARQFDRYGYRRNAALLGEAGWSVSDGRIERLW